MAGKNQVTLTFAGDSKSLDRALADVNSGTKRTEEGIDGLSDSASRLQRAMGTGGRQFGGYGSGLGGLGDRADEVDTRMMGLSDGIQGVNDLMHAGKLQPHEMAMAFSDLGSAAYNTVIPSLQSVVKTMGGLKTAAVGLGVALGAAGLLYTIHQLGQAAHDAKINDLAEDFQKTGDAGKEMQAAVDGDVFAMGNMADVFDKLLEMSPQLAQSYLDQAIAAGLDADASASAQKAIDAVADAGERAAEALNEMNDAYKAQFDPVFAAVDALDSMEEAQMAVVEANKEWGEGSVQSKEATFDLAKAVSDAESAQLALASAVEAGDVSIGSMNATLQRWVEQGILTSAQAADVAAQISGVTSEAHEVPGRVDTTLFARDRALPTIRSVEGAVEDLDGRTATVNIGANFGAAVGRLLSGSFASGGLVPGYFASGGIGGPRGTDTVPAWLTPGEMILNKFQQANLFRLLSGKRFARGGLAGRRFDYRGGPGNPSVYFPDTGGTVKLPRGTFEDEAAFILARWGYDVGSVAGNTAGALKRLAQQPWEDMSAHQSGSAGSQVNVYLTVQGSIVSDRDIVRIIRDEFQRRGFGGVR